MYENTYPEKRFQKTIEFLEEVVPAPARILDLGVKNPFSEIMQRHKYQVKNTSGEDLDENWSEVLNS